MLSSLRRRIESCAPGECAVDPTPDNDSNDPSEGRSQSPDIPETSSTAHGMVNEIEEWSGGTVAGAQQQRNQIGSNQLEDELQGDSVQPEPVRPQGRRPRRRTSSP